MTFQLAIIDTERHIFEGQAIKLIIPALGGEMTVLAKHMALVTPVGMGEVTLETPEREINLVIGKGIFSMEANSATLLVEDTSYGEEISESTAEAAKKSAEEIVEKGVQGPDLEAALNTIRRSNLNLRVLRRHKISPTS